MCKVSSKLILSKLMGMESGCLRRENVYAFIIVKTPFESLCCNCILNSAPALRSRDINIEVTCVEIVTLCGEWGSRVC